MEKKLKSFFDFMRFENNSRIEKMMQQAEDRYPDELFDDDLTDIFAAGEPVRNNKDNKDNS